MNYHWDVKFVGRYSELAQIEALVTEWNTRRVVFIQGEGGIGKTRLLSEIERKFKINFAKHSVKVPAIIDFDDERFKFPANVGFHIARQLNSEKFLSYFEALREFRIAEEKWKANSPMIDRKVLSIDRAFINSFNEFSKNNRVILRFDTTDAVENSASIKYLFDLALQINNIIIIIAGRNTDELFNKYASKANSYLITLRPFDLDNSYEYLKNKQEKIPVSFNFNKMEKLFILSGGLPVLIDLAIEWAQINRPIPNLEGISLEELERLQIDEKNGIAQAQIQLHDLREQFKRAIIIPYSNLSTDFDKLFIVLAKVFPLDLEGIMYMLNLSREESEKVMEKAKNSVTVKVLPDKRIKLHDAIQQMVQDIVWPEIDKGGNWRRVQNIKAIEYLTYKTNSIRKHIRELWDQQKNISYNLEPAEILSLYSDRYDQEAEYWSLQAQLLSRQLDADVECGYLFFEKEFEIALKDFSSMQYRMAILSTIEPYADLEVPKKDVDGNFLKEERRKAIQQSLANAERHRGMYSRAAQRYNDLLKITSPQSEEYVETVIGLANNLIRAGNLREARDKSEVSINMSRDLKSNKMMIDSILLNGWINRLMGEFDTAHKRYTEALSLALDINDEVNINRIFHSLAFVHALQRQEKSFTEVQSAISLWQDLVNREPGRRFYLGQCYNVAGEICIELEYSDQALLFFELSGDIFNLEEPASKEENNSQALEWRSKSRSGRGFAYWQMAIKAQKRGDVEIVQQYLLTSLDDLQWSEQNAALFDTPGVLNRLGEVNLSLQKFDEANRDFEESLDVSRRISSAYEELLSLGNLARLSFFYPNGNLQDWQSFENYYSRDYRRRYIGLYFEKLHGLLYTYLGHLALKSSQISDAIRFYNIGLPILSKNGSYADFNLAGQLKFIEENIFPYLQEEKIRELGTKLKEQWMLNIEDIAALQYFYKWSR